MRPALLLVPLCLLACTPYEAQGPARLPPEENTLLKEVFSKPDISIPISVETGKHVGPRGYIEQTRATGSVSVYGGEISGNTGHSAGAYASPRGYSADGCRTGPRGGRYKINSKGNKDYSAC